MNENVDTTYQNLYNAGKAWLRGKLIAAMPILREKTNFKSVT